MMFDALGIDTRHFPGDPECPQERHHFLVAGLGLGRELAERPLERQCIDRAECCHFRLTGKIPHLTRGEGIFAAAALRANGRKTLPRRGDGACPFQDPRGAH